MEAFAERFFPESHPTSGSRGGGGGGGRGGGARYCLYNDHLLSLGGSVIYLAALPALAAAAHCTQRYGRRPTMWANAALLAAGAAAGAAARGLQELMFSRVLLGMSMGCSFQAPTMLLSEALPHHQRGAGMYAYNLAMLAGFLVAAVANQLLQPRQEGWRVSIALQAAPAAALAALLPFVGEPPQVLLQRGDEAGAEQVLRALRPAGEDVTQELSQMRAAAARAAAPHPPAAAAAASAAPSHVACGAAAPGGLAYWRSACRRFAPELFVSVLYPLVLMVTGLNVLSTWMPNLLVALGAGPRLALAGNTAQMVIGLAAALPAAFVVERFGRRTLLAAGGAAIACSMGALAGLLAVYAPAAGAAAAPQPAAVLPAALALLCVNRVAMSVTLQPLTATVPAEIQPLEIRSAASSLTNAVRQFSSFLVTQFALPLLCATQWGLFAIFAAFTAAGVALLFATVPETRGLPIEEVHLAWPQHWLWGRSACVQARAHPPEAGGAVYPEDKC